MFWTDWGSTERIESSGLDGKDKRTIVTSGMFWPNAVTLDLNKKIVYILEAKWAKIISCNYDGSNQNVIYSSDEYLEQAFGLTFFANRLYWDSWKQRGVFSMDLNSRGAVQTVHRRSLGVSSASLITCIKCCNGLTIVVCLCICPCHFKVGKYCQTIALNCLEMYFSFSKPSLREWWGSKQWTRVCREISQWQTLVRVRDALTNVSTGVGSLHPVSALSASSFKPTARPAPRMVKIQSYCISKLSKIKS